ncbi:MAG TPA: SusD/RagB family nutrient-binding outer membrane lipoprotein, partial [Mucilaginibacter sp.]
DIAALDAGSGSFGAADLVYAGDPTAWKKFANTFKLKMGILLADVDAAKAQATVTSAIAGGVFTSNADNANFAFSATFPNTNPIWVDLVQSGRHDFVGTTEFISLLNPNTATQDPRTPYFFAQNSAGIYTGAPNGSGNGGLQFSLYSLPSGSLLTQGSIGQVTNPDFPGLLLDYSETEFNLAQAAARGYAVTGSVATHYNNAITASITYWGGSATDAATYLALPNVAYATASNPNAAGALTPLQKIALQQYLAFYNRGWDAWTATRFLDYPVLKAPTGAFSAFPVRLTYPISEQNVNVVNYTAASSAIGGDVVTTKLFFDLH